MKGPFVTGHTLNASSFGFVSSLKRPSAFVCHSLFSFQAGAQKQAATPESKLWKPKCAAEELRKATSLDTWQSGV